MPKVSVIIPCYNLGEFVEEAAESVEKQTYSDLEIIIINDGSTDERTNRILREYDRPNTKVIHTENQGSANTRNCGVRESSGLYILPLDADDKIAPTYIEKAVKVMDDRPRVGIVYCEAEFFGDKTGKWELPPYKFPEILLGNVIFCSALFRRSDWETVNGYNPNMVSGLEDFDFWLSLIDLGRAVFRIPEVLFYYRQRANSRYKSKSPSQFVDLYTQLFRNHKELYEDNIHVLFQEMLEVRRYAESLKAELDQLKSERNPTGDDRL
jgi:glycosyltransferase involved in cell wall biosynthesis